MPIRWSQITKTGQEQIQPKKGATSGGRSPLAFFENSKKVPKFCKKKESWLCLSMVWISHLNCCFKGILEPAGPFTHVGLVKFLWKWPYSKTFYVLKNSWLPPCIKWVSKIRILSFSRKLLILIQKVFWANFKQCSKR